MPQNQSNRYMTLRQSGHGQIMCSYYVYTKKSPSGHPTSRRTHSSRSTPTWSTSTVSSSRMVCQMLLVVTVLTWEHKGAYDLVRVEGEYEATGEPSYDVL